MKNYQVDANGYYGEFGGAFVPDALRANINELAQSYVSIIESENFQKEYQQLLRDYVGRATPLFYAENLSKKYGTHIYLKREDLNHTGAHKLNNALGQALLAKRMGKTRVIAETGAGQHGVATATACALLGLECCIYMGELDTQRQALNVARMKMLGAEVVAATSGGRTLTDAVNEAFASWVADHESTYFLIGSAVGPHPYPDIVARFQSVISKEIRAQLKEKIGKETPDYVMACVGGGSNAIGAFYHFLDDEKVKLIAVEGGGLGADTDQTAATITIGKEGMLHGFKTIVMQDAEGNVREPYSISAGLDYPGVGPAFAHLAKEKRVIFYNATDSEALAAAFELSKLEGIIPALESSHALAGLKKHKFGKDEVVVINVSGRGDKDMETYMKYI